MTPTPRPVTVKELNERIAPMFPGLMGVEITEASPDRIIGTLLVRPELCTAGATLHGGAYMAFADTLGAVGTVVNLPAGKGTVTTSSSTQFLAGAPAGSVVTGESVALHKGRTTMVWQTMIHDANGRLCAVVTQNQLVIDTRA